MENLFLIAYNGKSEIVDGEDAMQERVCDICLTENLDDDEVLVFRMEDQL